MMISILLFIKVDVSVFIQFPHFAPITSCLLSPVLLLLLWSLVKGRQNDLLVYTIASPVAPSVLAPVKPTPPIPAPVKPPITQVYTRRQNPPVSSPQPTASTSDPVPDDDLPIALRKGRRQCVHPISSFCTYSQLSS